jgi:hypothetical protein
MPDGQGCLEMIGTDEAALIEDGIEDGQPQHLSLGTADHRTRQAGLAFAQVVIDLAPDRLRLIVALDQTVANDLDDLAELSDQWR